MKNVILFTLFVATFTFGAFAGGPDEPIVTVKNLEVVSLTISELKELYGADNVVFEDGAEMLDMETVTLQKQLYPCGDPNFFPCDGAFAIAKHQAQQQANACCCVIISGIECCDPSTGNLQAILFIALPKSPSCN